MGDINQINDVPAANLSQVNDVPYANISEVNDQGVAASGATQWALTAYDGYFAYAANSDLTSWTAYDAYAAANANEQNSGDGEIIAYGKNAQGAGIYVATRSSDDQGGNSLRELHASTTDITDGNEWTNINLDSDDAGNKRHMQCLMWGARANGATAGTWMAAGKQNTGAVFRSIDGAATWSLIDISGLAGHSDGSNSSHYIQGIASDGAGNWMFTQGPRIYYSTDDGASFAVSTPFSTNAPGRAQGITFTNNSWVVVYSRSSEIRFRSCAASDITDWGDEVTCVGPSSSNGDMTSPSNNSTNVKIASANGNVVACSENNLQINRFTVDGKTIGTVSKTTQTGHGTCGGLATDGTTWVMACEDGDLITSTDNGANWTQRLNAFQANGSSAIDLAGIAGNVFYPL